MFHGCGSVKYLGGLHPQKISRMWWRQIFGGSTPPKYLTNGVPSNIWGVYTPQIFDGTTSVYTPRIFNGCGSVKYLGAVHPANISRMGFLQIFGGSTTPEYFTDVVPSNISGVYTPKNISQMWFRQIFGGSTPPQLLTDVVPSNIWGLYTPQICHGCGSVKYLGGLHAQYIWGL